MAKVERPSAVLVTMAAQRVHDKGSDVRWVKLSVWMRKERPGDQALELRHDVRIDVNSSPDEVATALEALASKVRGS